ncbi:MFS transporter [Corynebacterium lizhenjunii]|uniref:MFS transporter n=1 Tax=Corynebacterium lizhenjunii TaxID=2709394 RepID=A0A7T0PBA7_9CORY|nr:MFS transporter [Corynebacterium lizhenjunii]QPK78537.1 MFS transporter [Corynebacterium lizhenjunii]
MLTQEWFKVALGMYLVAFGANLFAPMVLTYQIHAGLGELSTTFLFGVYAVGLIVALFIGGPASDARGRRAIIRPALLCTAAGSVILLAGYAGNLAALLIGRLTIGVAVGLAMSAGAAWMKELSPTVGIGARRSSLALTLGFATAPLFSGLMAQFLPGPTLAPYAAHLALALVIIPLTWNAPARPPQGGQRAWFPRSLLTARFLPVACYAPWVFGAASTSFAFLPGMVRQHTSAPIAVAGCIALLTMGTGAVVQRWALNWSAAFGMVAGAVGMGIGLIIVLNREHAWSIYLLPLSAIVLGVCYGTNMVIGLAQTQALAPPHELGAATGVFYTLTYLGFFAPFILSAAGPIVGYSTTFVVGIVAALLTMLFAAYSQRGNGA